MEVCPNQQTGQSAAPQCACGQDVPALTPCTGIDIRAQVLSYRYRVWTCHQFLNPILTIDGLRNAVTNLEQLGCFILMLQGSKFSGVQTWPTSPLDRCTSCQAQVLHAMACAELLTICNDQAWLQVIIRASDEEQAACWTKVMH